jgi:hypothetical protein
VKIGDAKGNTGSRIIAEQSTLCVEALRAEIGSLRPLATILLSGNFARDEIFYPTFGYEGWRGNVEAEGSMITLEKIAAALGVKVRDLF